MARKTAVTHDEESRTEASTDAFRGVARAVSTIVGTRWAFLTALLIVVGWAITGPFFHFSDAWQLVINTGTTIVTFLMVFLIQATQNRDGRAIQLKLDELIRSSKARNAFADLEDASEEEIEAFRREFERLRNGRSPHRRREGRHTR